MAQTNVNTLKINDACVHQPLRDLLLGLVTVNLNAKNPYSAATNVSTISMSTAGDFAINGQMYTKAASTAAWLLTTTNCSNQATIPIGGAAQFILSLNAAGSGVAVQGDVLSSAVVSAAGGYAAAIAAQSRPDIPATHCPVAILAVAAGGAAHVPGSSTWSLLASAAGSATFTNILSLNKTS